MLYFIYSLLHESDWLNQPPTDWWLHTLYISQSSRHWGSPALLDTFRVKDKCRIEGNHQERSEVLSLPYMYLFQLQLQWKENPCESAVSCWNFKCEGIQTFLFLRSSCNALNEIVIWSKTLKMLYKVGV